MIQLEITIRLQATLEEYESLHGLAAEADMTVANYLEGALQILYAPTAITNRIPKRGVDSLAPF